MSSSLLIMLYRIMPSDSRYLTIIQLRLPITSKMYHPPPVPKMLFKRRPRRPKDHLKGTPGPGILKSLQNAGSAGRPSAFKKEALGTSLGRPPPPCSQNANQEQPSAAQRPSKGDPWTRHFEYPSKCRVDGSAGAPGWVEAICSHVLDTFLTLTCSQLAVDFFSSFF